MKILSFLSFFVFTLNPLWASQLTSLKLKKMHTQIHLLSDPTLFSFLKSSANNKLIAISNSKTDPDYETLKLQHYYKGLEVVGSMVMHHQIKGECKFSYRLAYFSSDLTPKLAMPKMKAIKLGRDYLKLGESAKAKAILKIMPDKENHSAQLVYWIDFKKLEGRLLIINAMNGKVIMSISKRHRIAPVTVYSGNYKKIKTNLKELPEDPKQISKSFKNACQVISTDENSDGSPLLLTPKNCELHLSDIKKRPSSPDKSAMRAYQNTQFVLKYFLEKHGRNSFDDKGSEVVSVVHAGEKLENAYWDEEHNFMAYGDGNGEKTKDFTLSLDLGGHEFTHGITANTAKLISDDEAGALNESYSDFFGIMISHFKNKNDDWSIGRDLYDPDGSSDEVAMRSIANPGRFKTFTKNAKGEEIEVPFPSKMSEKLAVGEECNDENDNCEVHANSTIPSHAAYLIAKAVGEEIASKIYYIVLTQRLTSTATFKEAAEDTIDVCSGLYSEEICQKVRRAFVITQILK